MEENLFRIGGVYRNGRGALLRIGCECRDGEVYTTYLTGERGGVSGGVHALADGRYMYTTDSFSYRHLIPGELHQINGEWVAMSEGVIDPNRVEDETGPSDPRWKFYFELLGEPDPRDLEMIARDGAKPILPAIVAAKPTATPTSHAPIAGLTRVSGLSHLLGAGVR